MANEPGNPDALTVTYQWKEASLPPPHHYEYAIHVGPGRSGRIDYWPDYPSPEAPQWTESFEVSEEKLVELRRLESATEPTPDDRRDRVSVGGALESLEATRNGEAVGLAVSTEAGRLLAEAVRSAVPEEIWQSLDRRRQTYARSPTTH